MVFIVRCARIDISIHFYIDYSNAVCFIFPHDFNDRTLGVTAGIAQGILFAVGEHAASIRNANILQEGNFRRQVFKADILLRIAVTGNFRHNQRKQDDYHDDPERQCGDLILA